MKKLLILIFVLLNLFAVEEDRNIDLFSVANPDIPKILKKTKTKTTKPTSNAIKPTTKSKAVVEINLKKKKVKDLTKNKFIAKTLVKKDDDNKIMNIRKKMEERNKLLSKPISQIVPIRRKVIVNKNSVQVITVKKGLSTLLSFVDESNNPVKLTYVSVGNSAISLRVFDNNIELKANAKYRVTNLIIGINKLSEPLILTVKEDTLKNSYDAYVLFKLAGTYSLRTGSNDNIKIKSLILKELYRYDKIKDLPRLDYETYSLKNSLQTIFDADLLKVYRVQKYNKTYYLVLLDKKFKIVGNNLVFGKYSAKYNVYFLNFNQTVFTIKTDIKKMPNEFKELYRIVIKNF